MNPLVLHFASGLSLFSGGAVLLLAVLLASRLTSPWLGRLRNLLAAIGIAFVIMASAPHGWWLYVLLIAAFIFWFITQNVERFRLKRPLHLTASGLCLASLLLFVALEAIHLGSPTLPPLQQPRLYVVGDSISSGIEAGFPPWPDVFAKTHHVEVVNLSRPGIGMAEALPLGRKIDSENGLVLLEIGGNDLLGGLSAEDFERQLDQLLREVVKPNRTVVMMELPLLPHFIPHGRIQRRLATQYNVPLIPKRHFVSAIAGADATSDGLHLSEAGTHRMVDSLSPILLPALKR